jgi:membrane associated rhomboid family serine protease
MSSFQRHPIGSVFTEIPRVTLAILVTCLLVWFVEVATLQHWDDGYWLHLKLSAEGLLAGKIWQLVTYQALHDTGLSHILFNMLVLLFFGVRLERRWGGWGFLRYFLACGIGGGLLYVLAALVLGDPASVVGASGAIMGAMLACALIWPRDRVTFMLVLSLELRQLVVVAALIDLMMAWLGAFGGSATGAVAHLGGALTGWAYLAHAHRVTGFLGGAGGGPLARTRRWWRRRSMTIVDRDFDKWLKDRDEDTRH